ncbi:16S rRNA (uracil(1498)-N(3))-methyltransferase [Granulicella sp. S190]|uniref:RsmE family RNA methyltransferase n=1 Tax=Granulicella sp. S190 TaxID=1747226 RepID=UPI00131D0CA8|nr:RsmE family RNA methyltransferase [Granulicella sp. S190]
MTRRRWIADTWTDTTATLTGDQAAHLARVLRAEAGQVYDVVSNGFLHRAEITRVTAGAGDQDYEVLFTLHEELESDAALPLHLLLAVFKFDHMEWAIEKATELGIAKITPILARRTEKHLAQSALKRSERWRRIALEASKQSRRTDIPDIADPIPLKQALEQEHSLIRILLSETEQSLTLASALDNSNPSANDWKTCRVPHPSQPYRDEWEEQSSITSITHAIAIGPEGGWTPEEMSLFTQHQWQPVTLGPRILRAETAAIAAIAIASTHLH